jgi:hypothetical protein
MENLGTKFNATEATIGADMLRRVRDSIPRLAVAFLLLHGGNFDHLL